jgi:hypothetical protein
MAHDPESASLNIAVSTAGTRMRDWMASTICGTPIVVARKLASRRGPELTRSAERVSRPRSYTRASVGLGSHVWRLSDRVRHMAQEDEGARGDRDKNEREHDREAHALRDTSRACGTSCAVRRYRHDVLRISDAVAVS